MSRTGYAFFSMLALAISACAPLAPRPDAAFDSMTEKRAQVEAARAANVMLTATYVQIGLAGLGAVGLILTLLATRHTLGQSARALRLAERTAQQQLRAYVEVSYSSMRMIDGDWAIEYRLKNCGQSPALRVRVRSAFMPVPATESLSDISLLPVTEWGRLRDIMPGSAITTFVEARGVKALLDAVAADPEQQILFWMDLEFEDIFGIAHGQRFSGYAGGAAFLYRHANSAYLGPYEPRTSNSKPRPGSQ